MNNKIIIFAVFLLLFLIPVSADINITIKSGNQQRVLITNLTTYYDTFYSNEAIPLNYDNYNINLYPTYTNLNNGTFINNVNIFVNDRYQFIWLGVIILIIVLAFMFIKRL